MNFKQDDQSLLQRITLTARSHKEIEAKSSKLGTLEDKDIYPIHTFWQLYQRAKHLRAHLAEDHSLFLANIMEINCNKTCLIFPVTIAN